MALILDGTLPREHDKRNKKKFIKGPVYVISCDFPLKYMPTIEFTVVEFAYLYLRVRGVRRKEVISMERS